MFIVVLSPLLLPGMTLRPLHVLAALLGFAGAAVAILSYLTPLASTAVLITMDVGPFGWSIALATLMIMDAAIIGTRAR